MNAFPAGDPCAHNEAYECFACTSERHAAAHPEHVEGCLACHLATVRIYGRFTGPASMSESVAQFWHDGNPDPLTKQETAVANARAERRTRIG